MLSDIKAKRSAYFFSFRRFLLYFAFIHLRFSWTKETWSDWEFFIWNWEKNILFGFGNGAEFRPQISGIESPDISCKLQKNLFNLSFYTDCIEVLSGLPLIIHLKLPWLFPISLISSFPYLWQINKKLFFILYFNGANCITSNLGVTLKGKNFLPKGANSFP